MSLWTKKIAIQLTISVAAIFVPFAPRAQLHLIVVYSLPESINVLSQMIDFQGTTKSRSEFLQKIQVNKTGYQQDRGYLVAFVEKNTRKFQPWDVGR